MGTRDAGGGVDRQGDRHTKRGTDAQRRDRVTRVLVRHRVSIDSTDQAQSL